jgi:hypothetical protein
MAESVETWLDELCRVFAVSDGERPIRSFLVFERNELPESITPEMTPCAVSYVTDLQLEYSTGGPTLFFWQGQTDLHLTRDVKTANVASIMKYYGRIVTAAAGNMKLNNLVEHFTILQGTAGSMQFVTYKHPITGADDHQGIVVRWMVKQNVSGDYVVSA